MRCPNCSTENSDSAKFCKKCGSPLKEKVVNNVNTRDNQSINTTKYVIVALAIVVVLAGAFVYMYGLSSSHNDSQLHSDSDNQQQVTQSDEPVQAQSSESSQSSSSSDSMSIISGSFSTNGGMEDKTYASLYVGSQHAGEKVQVQIYYFRDGSTLNHGNMVPITVDSKGYLDVVSADAYEYYPDYAEINLYDNSGKLLDTESVNLSPTSGIQTF